MKIEVKTGNIYIVGTSNGRIFCAKCIAKDDSEVVFESKRGLTTKHLLEDIVLARMVR